MKKTQKDNPSKAKTNEAVRSREHLTDWLREKLTEVADNLATVLANPLTKGIAVDMLARILADKCTEQQIKATVQAMDMWPMLGQQDPMLN